MHISFTAWLVSGNGTVTWRGMEGGLLGVISSVVVRLR